MIKVLEKMIARIETWPKERQEDAARILETMEAIGSSVYELSDEERADLSEALEEVRRGEIASDTQVADFFNRHRA